MESDKHEEQPSDLKNGEHPAGNSAKPKRRRRWKRYVLLTFVLLFVAGEVGLRLFADRNSKFNIVVGGDREFDARRRVRLKKNYHAGEIQTNSKGFLGPEFEAKKAPDSYRIVTLGDSCSFFPPQRPYPRVLEELLRGELPDRNIELINGACSGYDAGQSLAWYEEQIDGYDHDMLIIYLGWNDMGQYNPDGQPFKLERTGYLPEPNLIQKMMINCYLFRALFVLKTYWDRSSAFSTEPLTPQERVVYDNFHPSHFEQNITAIIELAQSRGRRVFLLNYASLVTEDPTPDEQQRMHFPRGMGRRLHKYLALKNAYELALRKVAEQTGTPIIDIESSFRTPESRLVFTDSVHFTVEGAERIAASVAEAVKPLIESPVDR